MPFVFNVPIIIIFLVFFFLFFTFSNAKHGGSIGIGLEASSTSKGPQAKTTEPMDSTKVTYCSIQLG